MLKTEIKMHFLTNKFFFCFNYIEILVKKIRRFIFRKFVKTCHKPDYSYIEARFQDQVARTTVAVGPNPAWNQELALTFKSLNNDYSPETLNRVKDCLHLHLFDEVTTDLVEDEADKDSKVKLITFLHDS